MSWWELENGLANYAKHSDQSEGRLHPESSHLLRNEFQRDRDRIIHTRAFRRLESKTQVFLNGTGGRCRTRLTHTIEVAAIARTIARALHANEDLTETVALAHDLGHPPFGHTGEHVLDDMMADHGGFDHNCHCLRVVDLLEIKYPHYSGLNLTWETRSALVKHRAGKENLLDGRLLPDQLSIEGQIADVADDLTYLAHDLDDGLDCHLFHFEDLEDVTLWQMAVERAKKADCHPNQRAFVPFTIRCFIDMMVADVVKSSRLRIEQLRPSCCADIEAADKPVVALSDEMNPMFKQLKDFLYQNMYWNPIVENVNKMASDRLQKLFRNYVKYPEMLGTRTCELVDLYGLYPAVCDYVASMTDLYAMDKFQQFGIR